MDVYYVAIEGLDPETYIKNFSHRFTSCHIRDILKERLSADGEEESTCDPGKGILNYKQILSVGLQHGMGYFYAEPGRSYYKETSLQSAKINIDYLKPLRFLEKKKR